jgi:uncharacterized GH25 family protein
VSVGGPDAPGADVALGLPLEIVADSNPYQMSAGGMLTLRLLFHGEPLQGALVEARRKGRGETALSARTDAEGRARLVLEEAGVWLIAAVHMTESSKGLDADYESWWASLTFELTSGES